MVEFRELLKRLISHHAVEMDVGGFQCRVVELETLIAAKKFAGRDKDVTGVRHLEVIRKIQQQQPGLFDKPKDD
jgi:hypothetical protein